MARRAFALLALLSVLGCGPRGPRWPSGAADPATRRSLPAGELVGTGGRYGSDAWLGIPYAAPPTGERRWRAPAPAPRWEGTREALHFGAACPQFASPLGGVEGRAGSVVGDEDCLTLNVYAPRFEGGDVPPGTRLPVLFWIHGGGNSIGHAAFYEGGHLAAKHRAVVVTVQYRLGPLGWWRHPAIAAGVDPVEASGNFALLDLAQALHWVHDNVSGFGGDPGNVTIFGESAGGRNVYALLLMPQAAGLFQRAIVESGGLRSATPAEAEHRVDDPEPGHRNSSAEVTLRLLVAAGQAADRAAAEARVAAMSPAELASFLRARTPAELLQAYDRAPEQAMLDMPQVFSDGVVQPKGDPLDRLASADGWNRVPVIVGTNRDENKLFLYLDESLVRHWFGVIPRVRNAALYQAFAEALSREWKVVGADAPATAMRRVEPNVFVYRFDWDEEPKRLGADFSMLLGAAHGFEIPFVFGHFHLGRRIDFIYTRRNAPGREALSTAMMSYWAAFARNGAPDRGVDATLPAWTPWDDSTPESPRTLILDTPEGGGIRMSNASETMTHIVADVQVDARLPNARARCRLFHDMVRWGGGLSKDDYARLVLCRDYPYDAFPWAGH